MQLHFLRHAIAVARGTPGFEEDRVRPLTEKGRLRMRRVAQGMKAAGFSFDLILSSPFKRAKATAEIVASVFKAEDKLAFWPTLEPKGDPAALVRELARQHAAAESVLLVGHEPDLSRLISVFVTGKPDAAIVMKKGGLCSLEVDQLCYGKCARLISLLRPKQLIAMR